MPFRKLVRLSKRSGVLNCQTFGCRNRRDGFLQPSSNEKMWDSYPSCSSLLSHSAALNQARNAVKLLPTFQRGEEVHGRSSQGL
jgi:hypothetical protein